MIKIIAHRGMWLTPEEKNTFVAFERALKYGFGIETDFRDRDGQLVISHDPAKNDSMLANDFFNLCERYPDAGPHAINVKSDGLQALLQQTFRHWSDNRYFVFDMSVPDTLGYLRLGLNTFTRVSEYEPYQNFGGKTSGVWLDAFHGQWYDDHLVRDLTFTQQSVAIVSPEIHDRGHHSLWAMLKSLYTSEMSLMLCTDLPLEAQQYFHE